MEVRARRKIKDSVFSALFEDKRNIVLMYNALHPEDKTVTEDDITNVTIQNVLVDTIYNDLGFMVRNKLIVLVEAQSTWSVNIVIRILMYLMQSYQDYIKLNKLNVYSRTKITLPVPELYVIYTGDEKNIPKTVSVREDLFNGAEGTIIYEYVTFTKVYNEQYKLYGQTRKTIEETIRICKDRNILKKFLSEHEREVVDTMMLLFDDEFIQEAALEEKYREGEEKGIEKGKLEGIKEGISQILKALRSSGADEAMLQKAASMAAQD